MCTQLPQNIPTTNFPLARKRAQRTGSTPPLGTVRPGNGSEGSTRVVGSRVRRSNPPSLITQAVLWCGLQAALGSLPRHLDLAFSPVPSPVPPVPPEAPTEVLAHPRPFKSCRTQRHSSTPASFGEQL